MNTIPVPKPIQELASYFAGRGVILYLVGGSVRNAQVSLPATDFDVTSQATPTQVMAFFKDDNRISVIPKALDFGTVQINIKTTEQKLALEHTTFREDFYHSGGSHRPQAVRFTSDIAADARRRDFTINALYYDILKEKLEDPLGGLTDLDAMRLCAAKEEAAETLSDDGLRIMRMARFAAELNFRIAPDLFAAARRYAEYLTDITPERKQTELKKILLSDIKYGGYNGAFNASKPKRGMMILKEIGALDSLFPSLSLGAGVSQNTLYHAHDVLMHGLCTMAETPPDYALRLAGLLHDIGKPVRLKETGKMLGHDTEGAKMAAQELNALKTPKAVIRETVSLIRHHMFDLTGEAKINTIKKKAGELGFVRFRKLIALRRADVAGSGADTPDETADRWERVLDDMIKNGTPQTIADLDINGKVLMEALGLDSGETIGWLLKRLHARVLLSPAQNKKEQLIVLARQILKER